MRGGLDFRAREDLSKRSPCTEYVVVLDVVVLMVPGLWQDLRGSAHGIVATSSSPGFVSGQKGAHMGLRVILLLDRPHPGLKGV